MAHQVLSEKMRYSQAIPALIFTYMQTTAETHKDKGKGKVTKNETLSI